MYENFNGEHTLFIHGSHLVNRCHILTQSFPKQVLLPEVAVGVNDPVSGRFDALLLLLHLLLAPVHAQGEFIDPGLQHAAELPLHEARLAALRLAVLLRSILGFEERHRVAGLLRAVDGGRGFPAGGVGKGHFGILLLRDAGVRGVLPLRAGRVHAGH